jgi:hypothetical protein
VSTYTKSKFSERFIFLALSKPFLARKGFTHPLFLSVGLRWGLIFQFHRVCESYRWAIVFDLICAVVIFFSTEGLDLY